MYGKSISGTRRHQQNGQQLKVRPKHLESVSSGGVWVDVYDKLILVIPNYKFISFKPRWLRGNEIDPFEQMSLSEAIPDGVVYSRLVPEIFRTN